MNEVKKEQIFFIVTLLLMGWLIYSTINDVYEPTRIRKGKAEAIPEGRTVPGVLPIDPTESYLALQGRDVFLTPREWLPLDAIDLALPPLAAPTPLAPMPTVRTDVPFRSMYRVSGENMALDGEPDGESEEEASDGAPSDDSLDDANTTEEPEVAESRSERDARMKRQWDWIRAEGSSRPFFGVILNKDKWNLEDRGQEAIEFDRVGSKGQLNRLPAFPRERVIEFGFADTVINRFHLQRRELFKSRRSLMNRLGFVLNAWTWAEDERNLLNLMAEECESILNDADADPAAKQAVGNELGKVYAVLGSIRAALMDREGELEAYRRGLASGLRSASLYRQWGDYLARYSLSQEAENAYREALDIDRGDAETMVAFGEFLLADGRGAEALAQFAAASRARGNNSAELRVRVLTGSSKAAFFDGDVDAALGHIERALTIDPAAVDAVITKACILYAQGQYEEARLQVGEIVTSMESPPAEALYTSGVLLTRLGRLDEAKRRLDRAAFLDPLNGYRSERALAFVAELSGNDVEALERYRLGVDMNPGDAFGLYLLGRAQRKTGSYEEAVETLRTSLRHDGRSVDTLRELGFVSLLLGRDDEARIYLEESLSLEPDDPEVLNMLAHAMVGLGDINGAREIFLSLIDRDDQNPVFLNGLAFCEYRLGRSAISLREFAKVEPLADEESAQGAYARASRDGITLNLRQERWSDEFAWTKVSNGWEAEERFGAVARPMGDGFELTGMVQSQEQDVRTSLWREVKASTLISIESELLARSESQGRYGLMLLFEQGSDVRMVTEVKLAISANRDGEVEFFAQDKRANPGKWTRAPEASVRKGDPVVFRIDRVPEAEVGKLPHFQFSVDGVAIGEPIRVDRAKNKRAFFRALIFSEADPGQTVSVESHWCRIVREKGS